MYIVALAIFKLHISHDPASPYISKFKRLFVLTLSFYCDTSSLILKSWWFRTSFSPSLLSLLIFCWVPVPGGWKSFRISSLDFSIFIVKVSFIGIWNLRISSFPFLKMLEVAVSWRLQVTNGEKRMDVGWVDGGCVYPWKATYGTPRKSTLWTEQDSLIFESHHFWGSSFMLYVVFRGGILFMIGNPTIDVAGN